MRAVLAILLLVLCTGGAFLLFADDDAVTPPPGGSDEHSSGQRPSPPTPERSGTATRSDVSPAPSPIASEAPRPEPESPAPPAEPAATNVVVTVRAANDQRAIAPFRWRFTRADAAPLFGESSRERAELLLPPGTTGELRIEAPDHLPFAAAEFAVPAADAAPRQLDVFLDGAMTATGITLRLRDAAGQPVPHVRVDAWRVAPEQREGAWHLAPALWARRADADTGDYSLPSLEPGDYGVRVLATDQQGELLPLLPFRRTFTVTGSNGFVEDVFLEPGCALHLDFVTGGEALDPVAHGAVSIGLTLAGAPATPRLWTVRDEAGKLHSAVDALPQRGTAWLAEPLPAGNYHLEVLVAGAPRLRQPLLLLAGQTQRERIVVP